MQQGQRHEGGEGDSNTEVSPSAIASYNTSLHCTCNSSITSLLTHFSRIFFFTYFVVFPSTNLIYVYTLFKWYFFTLLIYFSRIKFHFFLHKFFFPPNQPLYTLIFFSGINIHSAGAPSPADDEGEAPGGGGGHHSRHQHLLPRAAAAAEDTGRSKGRCQGNGGRRQPGAAGEPLVRYHCTKHFKPNVVLYWYMQYLVYITLAVDIEHFIIELSWWLSW